MESLKKTKNRTKSQEVNIFYKNKKLEAQLFLKREVIQKQFETLDEYRQIIKSQSKKIDSLRDRLIKCKNNQ